MPRPVAVTLYVREGCTLCVEAQAALSRIGRRVPLVVTTIDIEGDDALMRRFMLAIPVVEAEGEVVAVAPVREGALEDTLAAVYGNFV
jgi:Glutaredoxin-like domain (DUF836)